MDNFCNYCNALHFSCVATRQHLISVITPFFFINPTVTDPFKKLIFIRPNFVAHMRKYNSAVAFAWFSATRNDMIKVLTALKHKTKLTIHFSWFEVHLAKQQYFKYCLHYMKKSTYVIYVNIHFVCFKVHLETQTSVADEAC